MVDTSKESIMKYAQWIVAALVAGVLLWKFFVWVSAPLPEGTINKTVHWHSNVNIEICGKSMGLIDDFGGREEIGDEIAHLHRDDGGAKRIHIEGFVNNGSDITLGRAFDTIGVKFDTTHIRDKENGKGCDDGNEHQVRMSVDGQPNQEFRDHIMRDEEHVLITY